MDYKPLPIGVSDFAEMIRNDYYYVDKTLMIRDLLNNRTKVTLFTRPRRFGKTLNMSMLKYFFEDDRDREGNGRDWSQLFGGLKIMEAGPKYMSHMGRYPVICLTFKDAKRPDYRESFRQLADAITYEFKRHAFVVDCPALSGEKDRYEKFMSEEASEEEYAKSVLFLSRCLETYYGKKAVVLIDEYDVPLENSFARGFYDEMADFIRALFESGLKDNASLEFAVITGCLRVSKESIFTGLNNLNIVSIRSANFDEYFGFQTEEAKALCHDYGIDDQYETVKDWYDGYTFGLTDIYNPWSVLQYVFDVLPNKSWLPMAYWANTSSNDIVKTLIEHADDVDREKIEELIAGGTIEIQIHEDITYDEIYEDGDNLWNFLYFTGYFRKIKEWMEGRTIRAQLALPNKEVHYIFEQKVQRWFRDRVKSRDMKPFWNRFLRQGVRRALQSV